MRSFIVLVAGLALFSSSAIAQPYVIYEGNSDEQCSQFETIRDWGARHDIAIANPGAVQTEVTVTFLAENTVAGSGFYSIQVHYVNGFDTLFGTPPTVTQNDLGSAIEISIEAVATTGNGLPISADTIRYIEIWTNIDTNPWDNEVFCIDSSATSLGDWHFLPGPSPTWEAQPDNPGTGSPACFYVEVFPSTYSVVLDCMAFPWTYQTDRFCDTMRLYMFATPPMFGNPGYVFTLEEGPGVVDSFAGIWTWIPSAEDAGKDTTVTLSLRYNICDPDRLGPWQQVTPPCEINLHPGPNAPPTFVNSHEMDVTVSGQPLSMQCAVNDEDPCTDYTYSYIVPGGEPIPPIQLDAVTGEVTYPANPEDTNTYHFSLVVEEGEYADTTEVTLYHWDSPLCGDMNHDGSSDISDLTWVVGYAFKSGVSPSPPEAGNVNCIAGVDVSDITYLVKYMFASGPDPCDCK